jgi:hypothetical protein
MDSKRPKRPNEQLRRVLLHQPPPRLCHVAPRDMLELINCLASTYLSDQRKELLPGSSRGTANGAAHPAPPTFGISCGDHEDGIQRSSPDKEGRVSRVKPQPPPKVANRGQGAGPSQSFCGNVDILFAAVDQRQSAELQ